jgi:phospholipid-translocating ATPase
MTQFGRSGLWWLTLILTSAVVMLWEFAVVAIRIAYFPSDTDVFQELQKDAYWKERFRKVASGEDDELDEGGYGEDAEELHLH